MATSDTSADTPVPGSLMPRRIPSKLSNAPLNGLHVEDVFSSSSFEDDVFVDAHSHRQSLEADIHLIPPSALVYNPRPEEILKPIGSGKPIRLIFGDLPLTQWEDEAVQEVKKTLKYDPDIFERSIFKDDRYVVRFIQGNDWDIDRCTADMVRHLRWRSERLPVSRNLVQSTLPKGFLYIHGRDECFRPIVIIRCKEIAGSTVDEVLPVVIYWLEFTVIKLLVKNRVEQWRVIMDLSECSITNAPVGILKHVCDTLMRNYRGRLASMVILNVGFLFKSLWQIVSVMLPDRTKNKIRLCSSVNKDDILGSVHPSQVEGRYGGEAPDAADFSWPTMPPWPLYNNNK